MTPRELAQNLAKVPGHDLAIFELARRLTGADGEIDSERAVDLAQDIQTAVREARAYASAVRAMAGEVLRLPPVEAR